MIEGTEVLSPRGVVAANPPEAARVGARMLESGGNAMDAACAASLACCMLEPHMAGIGGYACVAVVRESKSNRVFSVDANATAPAAAQPKMFELRPSGQEDSPVNEAEFGCSVKDNANVHGPMAVAVPGTLAGIGSVQERWGKLKWDQVVAPCLSLLSDGFPYARVAEAIAANHAVISRFPATRAHLMPAGKPPDPEDLWHRPDMEKTLQRVALAGWRDFYDGQIGRAIADHLCQAGGIVSRADMAGYRPRITPPLVVSHGNANTYGPILPNGCLTSLQILNMLECVDLPREDTVTYWHLYAEVLKLAWRDRLAYLGDPDFVDVPQALLLSKDYAAGRVETIRRFPLYVDRLTLPPEPQPPPGTLHISTADADGNVVSMTITQGADFGSCLTVPGSGIILGHGMCRFDPRPGKVNSIAPRKRPLNNIACMLIQLPQRIVAAGLPGSRAIIAVMSRAAQLIVDRGLTGHQVATAPRMDAKATEPIIITKSVGQATIDGLRTMGHKVDPIERVAGVMNCAEKLNTPDICRAGSGLSAAAPQ